jgi:hypothetical protein
MAAESAHERLTGSQCGVSSNGAAHSAGSPSELTPEIGPRHRCATAWAGHRSNLLGLPNGPTAPAPQPHLRAQLAMMIPMGVLERCGGQLSGHRHERAKIVTLT